MEILKVETESSFFGLRKRIRFLVGASALDGQPEDYWMYATEHNIRYMAESLNKAHVDLKEARRANREQPRRQLVITLKELSATVADAVERSVAAHPAIRVLLDKVGGFASGGIVDNRPSKRVLGDEPSPLHCRAAAQATSELKTTTVEGRQCASGVYAPALEVRLLDESADPSDVARQIREIAEHGIRDRGTSITEPVPNTSLDPVTPVEGISATREDRLSPND